jgi:hypothetical protein
MSNQESTSSIPVDLNTKNRFRPTRDKESVKGLLRIVRFELGRSLN